MIITISLSTFVILGLLCLILGLMLGIRLVQPRMHRL